MSERSATPGKPTHAGLLRWWHRYPAGPSAPAEWDACVRRLRLGTAAQRRRTLPGATGWLYAVSGSRAAAEWDWAGRLTGAGDPTEGAHDLGLRLELPPDYRAELLALEQAGQAWPAWGNAYPGHCVLRPSGARAFVERHRRCGHWPPRLAEREWLLLEWWEVA